MGAHLITITAVVDEQKSKHCTLEGIKQYLADTATVRRILDNSAYPREQVESTLMWDGEGTGDGDAREIETAQAILTEGAESFIDGYRTHDTIPMGHDLLLVVGGGLSWGDDPYDGYSSEVVFVEAALCDPGLNALVGIVGAPEIDRINEYLAQRDR